MLSQSPLTSKISLITKMVHEIAYALGLLGTFDYDVSSAVLTGENTIARTSHLYDDNEQKLASNQIVWSPFKRGIRAAQIWLLSRISSLKTA